MTRYHVIPATMEHARELAANMREADAAECWAIAHHTPLEAVQACMRLTRHPWAGMADDKVLCMLGVAARTTLGDATEPWFLSSKELPKHSFAFSRRCRVVAQRMFAEYERLENLVDARYTTAVSWLRWLGFEILPAEPFGREQRLFHRFRKP